jgi:hypothetical protein
MIWTCLICSNIIIFRLDIKQPLAQHIRLLGYLLPTSPWELPYGLTEQFLRGIAVPLADTCLCCFLVTIEALYSVEHSAVCRCFPEIQITEMNI